MIFWELVSNWWRSDTTSARSCVASGMGWAFQPFKEKCLFYGLKHFRSSHVVKKAHLSIFLDPFIPKSHLRFLPVSPFHLPPKKTFHQTENPTEKNVHPPWSPIHHPRNPPVVQLLPTFQWLLLWHQATESRSLDPRWRPCLSIFFWGKWKRKKTWGCAAFFKTIWCNGGNFSEIKPRWDGWWLDIYTYCSSDPNHALAAPRGRIKCASRPSWLLANSKLQLAKVKKYSWHGPRVWSGNSCHRSVKVVKTKPVDSMTSWWFQPTWKMLVKMECFPK